MKFSIVTPSYNQGRFIEATIRSVLGQTYPDYEYIVIDGGSSDNTDDIVSRYAERIKHYTSEPDRGQVDAINKGFGHASGDILAYLNSDDCYLQHTLQTVARYFEKHPDVDVIYGNCVYVDEGGSFLKYFPGVAPFDKERLLNNVDFIMQPAAFWRKGVFDRYGPFDDAYHYGFDWAFWCELASHGCKFLRVNEVLASNRVHEATKTGTGGINRVNELKVINKKYKTKVLPHAYYGFAREEYRSRPNKNISDYLKLAQYAALSYENIIYYFRHYDEKIVNGFLPESKECLKTSGFQLPNDKYSRVKLKMISPGRRPQRVKIYQLDKVKGDYDFIEGEFEIEFDLEPKARDISIFFEFSHEYCAESNYLLKIIRLYRPGKVSAMLERFELYE